MFSLQERVVQEHIVKARSPLTKTWEALLVRRGIVAYLPIAVATILLFYGVSWEFPLFITDTARYQCYALTFWHGSDAIKPLPAEQCKFLLLDAYTKLQAATSPHVSTPPPSLTQLQAMSIPPFHTLPMEYPPLTLLVFSLGLFAPLANYPVLFALWMALAALFIYWLLLRYGPRGAAPAFALYLLIGGWSTAEARFDLLPAACTLICVIAAGRKRWTLAYVALAFGVLLKIYPLLLLPALFIAEQRAKQRFYIPRPSKTLQALLMELLITLCGVRRWRWKNSLIFFGVLLAVTIAFAILNFQGAIVSQLGYFADRPVQIEAVGSALLWFASQLEFYVHVQYSFGSVNVVGGLDRIVSLLCAVSFVLGYAYVLWLQWRSRLDLVQASIAILLVFVVTGKVFSPQYLIWIIPLLAYSNALDGFWLLCWGALSLMTTSIYPFLYTRALTLFDVTSVPGFLETILARNALFVLLTLAYLFNWFLARRRVPIIAAISQSSGANENSGIGTSKDELLPDEEYAHL